VIYTNYVWRVKLPQLTPEALRERVVTAVEQVAVDIGHEVVMWEEISHGCSPMAFLRLHRSSLPAAETLLRLLDEQRVEETTHE
jgi:hypothetical protein